MEIKIDSNGWLLIDNKKKFCPFGSDDPLCGDWCALFEGPRMWEERDDNQVAINLCQASWSCYEHEFTDERIKKER